ncbi:hypothetical protein JG688_00018659 [Phytophthora aleatoria]|uniref:Phytotoxin PcF domain-containing protein n=1 Tax=Phytophthora aleatoria TaxID=2496075 RepID=A0A8J5IR03_9STRA|nr:hypothetical protein JG688_00018659 [Phytophthora aleatoria]
MNLKQYVVVALVAVFATSISAQSLCAAEGCALITSPHNGIISECCSRQEGDFHACCRQSCNTGNPCKVE